MNMTMRTPRALAVAIGLAALTAISTTACASSQPTAPSTRPAAQKFVASDNTNYKNVAIGHGTVRTGPLSNRECNGLAAGGAIPAKQVWQDLVKKDNANTQGPLVVACENIYLAGSAETAAAHFKQLSHSGAGGIIIWGNKNVCDPKRMDKANGPWVKTTQDFLDKHVAPSS
jgi:hypothetical protein